MAIVVLVTIVRPIIEYGAVHSQVSSAAEQAAETAALTGNDKIAESLAVALVCETEDCDARSEVNIGSNRVSAYVHRNLDLPLVGTVTVKAVAAVSISHYNENHRDTA